MWSITGLCTGKVRSTPTWEAFLATGDAVPDAEVHARIDALGPEDVCDVIFTSGTTGQPKGVCLDGETQLAVARSLHEASAEVEVQRLAAAGWIALADGKAEEAQKFMRAAADLEDRNEKHIVTPGRIVPARELLAELLLELKQPGAAPGH